ncbi:MAG: hypothetical protein Q9183_006073, partial [Haloplaca sp. 2 TL-2023]
MLGDYIGYFDSWFQRIDSRLAKDDRNNGTRTDVVVGEIGRTQEIVTELIEPLDSKLDDLDAKVDDAEINLGGQLDGMYEQFHAEFDKLEFCLDDFRATSRNALCAQGWQRLKSVGRSTSPGTRRLPPVYVRSVEAFWHLKDPSM